MVNQFNILKKKIPADFFKNKPIKKAFLFGSYARNEAQKGSDIDILIELDTTKTVGLIEYIKIKDSLEEILKLKVDLVSSDGVSPHILPFINQDKILIYEA
jgi:uncharacterized protein